MIILTPPPCPVHEACLLHPDSGSGSGIKRGLAPCPEFEHVASVPEGHLAFIGPPDAFDVYVGDASVPVMLARHEMPSEYPAQLKIAMAPVMHEWEGTDSGSGSGIEPLRGGAFALEAGTIIDRNCCADVCLYNEQLDSHTILANWLVPSMN